MSLRHTFCLKHSRTVSDTKWFFTHCNIMCSCISCSVIGNAKLFDVRAWIRKKEEEYAMGWSSIAHPSILQTHHLVLIRTMDIINFEQWPKCILNYCAFRRQADRTHKSPIQSQITSCERHFALRQNYTYKFCRKKYTMQTIN